MILPSDDEKTQKQVPDNQTQYRKSKYSFDFNGTPKQFSKVMKGYIYTHSHEIYPYAWEQNKNYDVFILSNKKTNGEKFPASVVAVTVMKTTSKMVFEIYDREYARLVGICRKVIEYFQANGWVTKIELDGDLNKVDQTIIGEDIVPIRQKTLDQSDNTDFNNKIPSAIFSNMLPSYTWVNDEIMAKAVYKDYSIGTMHDVIKNVKKAHSQYLLDGGTWGPNKFHDLMNISAWLAGRYLQVLRSFGVTSVDGVDLPSGRNKKVTQKPQKPQKH